MAHKIIQWNCRGLRSNYNDLAILLQEHSPSAVCLQETNLKPNTNISFKNYTMVNCFGPANNERACWGVSILVKDGTPHQHITLKTNLQAVAVNINCHRPMTICSVYLPPNRSVDVVELRQLVKQLPKPFMLLGDFNGHHTMWGCRDINPRGRIIEDFLSEENLCIFNDDTPPIYTLLQDLQQPLTYPCVIPIYIWITLGGSTRISVAVIIILYL